MSSTTNLIMIAKDADGEQKIPLVQHWTGELGFTIPSASSPGGEEFIRFTTESLKRLGLTFIKTEKIEPPESLPQPANDTPTPEQIAASQPEFTQEELDTQFAFRADLGSDPTGKPRVRVLRAGYVTAGQTAGDRPYQAHCLKCGKEFTATQLQLLRVRDNKLTHCKG